MADVICGQPLIQYDHDLTEDEDDDTDIVYDDQDDADDDADIADTDDDSDMADMADNNDIADADGDAGMADADLLISLTLDLKAAPSHCSTLTSVLRGKQPVKGNFNMGWTFLKTSPCREGAELTQQGHWVDGGCVHPPVCP